MPRMARGALLGLLLLALTAGALYLLYGFSAGYFYFRGIWLPTPWNFILAAALAAGLLAGLVVGLARQFRSSRAAFGVTLLVFLGGVAAVVLYLATSPTTAPASLRTVFGGDDPAYPVSKKFPLELEAQGDDGTFVASVGNLTDETANVWCFVEAPIKDDEGLPGLSGMDFEVGPIPPGGSKTVTKTLEGNVKSEFSGGCKRTSY